MNINDRFEKGHIRLTNHGSLGPSTTLPLLRYVADLELRKYLVQGTPEALAGFGFKEQSPQYPPATSYSASRVFLIDYNYLSHALRDRQSALIFGAVAGAGTLDDACSTVNGRLDQ